MNGHAFEVSKIETYWVIAANRELALMQVKDGLVDPDQTIFEVE